MQMTPAANPTENAQWPLHGSTHVGVKLETADSITFRAELDFSGRSEIKIFLDKIVIFKIFRSRAASTKLLS